MSNVSSPDASPMVVSHSLKWLWLALLVILLDQGSKWLAVGLLQYAQPVYLLPVFDLTLLHNTGAAFSFLADMGGWQRWFFALIAIGMSAYLSHWLAKTPAGQWRQCMALALIIGGAVGNLIDRVWLGYVVDFISLHWGNHYYPAFNLADSAITLGAVLLIWDLVFNQKNRGA